MAEPAQNTDDPDAYRMSLGEHLDELRTRLVRSLLCLAVVFVLCWLFRDRLMSVMVRPHAVTMRALGQPEPLRLLKYQEGFYAYMKLAFLASFVIASPYVISQIWAYVRSGLYRKERRLAVRYGFVSVFLFLAGVVFGFFVLIPLGLQFLIRVSGGVAQPMIGLSDYLSLVTMLTIAAGIVFELPLVMRFVAQMGIMDAQGFREKRGPAILAAFVLAACLTPPDPFTQVLLAVPMVALYEVGIALAKPSRRNVLRVVALGAAVLGVLAAISLYGRFRDARAAQANGRYYPVGSNLPDDGQVALSGGGTVRLRREANVRLTARSVLDLKEGRIFVVIPDEASPLRVRTPDVEAVLAGARADIRVLQGATEVTCVSGNVAVFSEGSEGIVLAERRRRFAAGGEPVDVKKVIAWTRPREEGGAEQ